MNGIVYGTGDIIVDNKITSKELLLDMYEPLDASGSKRAVVMWLHGGAFVKGNRDSESFVAIANELAARGYQVLSIDYRTAYMNPVVSEEVQRYYDTIAPHDTSALEALLGISEEQYERAIAAAFDDGLTALKWLTESANEWPIDLSRLVLMGSSAGATTINYIAYTADDLGIYRPPIAAVINLWGGLEYTRARGGLATIEVNESPLFLVHSKEDPFVPYENSTQIVARAEAIGLPYEFHSLDGNRHGLTEVPILTMQSDNGYTLFERILLFLERHL
ncbi:MAG: alpha/beta hydrolase [Chloroflexota bacterium]